MARRPPKGMLSRSIMLAVGGLLLASCVVEEVPPRPGPRPLPPSGPAICTREYAPVCARRGNDIRTFSNSCMARADGYRVVDRGPCRMGGPGRPERPGRPESRPPAMCPMIYAPVCAGRGGIARTFGNDCQARAEGFRVLRAGPC